MTQKATPAGAQRAKFPEKVHKPPLWVNVIILNYMGLMHQYGSLGVPPTPKSHDALIEVLKFIRNKLYFRSCRKVANSSLSWLVAHFGRAYEGEI